VKRSPAFTQPVTNVVGDIPAGLRPWSREPLSRRNRRGRTRNSLAWLPRRPESSTWRQGSS